MLLAIDTATYRASVALHDGVTLRGEYTWEAINRHTVTLMPHITEMLEDCGMTSADLQALAVCVGPGSYTGVRIGVSAAKGLALALDVPLIGCTTLDILVAAQPPDPRPLYALFAAGRKRVGFRCFHWQATAWVSEDTIELATWPEFVAHITESALVVGEIDEMGLEALQSIANLVEVPAPAWRMRRAGFLADLAWARLQSGLTCDAVHVNPVYAR